MTNAEIIEYVSAEPFRPFRVTTTSGLTYDIRHPESIMVCSDIMIFTFVSDSPEIYDKWQSISLVLIESLSPLDSAVA